MRIKAEVMVPEENHVYWSMCALGHDYVIVNRENTQELLGSGSFGVVGVLNSKDADAVSEWVTNGEPVSVPKFRRITDDFGNETTVALITTDMDNERYKTLEVEYFDNPFEDYE